MLGENGATFEHLAKSERLEKCEKAHLPIGAPRPLDMQSETVSNGLHSSSSDDPLLATTSHIRAPSQCIITPSARILSEIRTIYQGYKTKQKQIVSSEFNHNGRRRRRGDKTHLLLGEHGPGKSVLQRHDPSGSTVDVVTADNVVFYVFEGEVVAVRRRDGEGVCLRMERHTASFVCRERQKDPFSSRRPEEEKWPSMAFFRLDPRRGERTGREGSGGAEQKATHTNERAPGHQGEPNEVVG